MVNIYKYITNQSVLVKKSKNGIIVKNTQRYSTPGILYLIKNKKNALLEIKLVNTQLKTIILWMGTKDKNTLKKTHLSINQNGIVRSSLLKKTEPYYVGILFPSGTYNSEFGIYSITIIDKPNKPIVNVTPIDTSKQQINYSESDVIETESGSKVEPDETYLNTTLPKGNLVYDYETDQHLVECVFEINQIVLTDIEFGYYVVDSITTDNIYCFLDTSPLLILNTTCNTCLTLNGVITDPLVYIPELVNTQYRIKYENNCEIIKTPSILNNEKSVIRIENENITLNMFKHYVITRFSVNIYNKPEVLTEPYLEYRYKIFKNITFESMKSQTNQNFEWLIIVDHKIAPNMLDKMNKLIEGYNHFKIVKYTHCDNFNLFLNKLVGNTNKILVTTRLDDDDGVANQFIKNIQNDIQLLTLTKKKPFLFITYPSGITLNYINSINCYEFYNPWIAIGLTLISRLDITIYSFNHRQIKDVLWSLKKSNIKELESMMNKKVVNNILNVFIESKVQQRDLNINQMLLLLRPTDKMILRTLHTEHLSGKKKQMDVQSIEFPRQHYTVNYKIHL